ncbi:hypothetical protein D3C85_768250 [compost metagenome]
MSLDEKLALLQAVPGNLQLKRDGDYICKHEDAMVKIDNGTGQQIVAYFMYYQTQEQAIEEYFKFVTQPGASILVMGSFTEYKYDGAAFVKVEKQ